MSVIDLEKRLKAAASTTNVHLFQEIQIVLEKTKDYNHKSPREKYWEQAVSILKELF